MPVTVRDLSVGEILKKIGQTKVSRIGQEATIKGAANLLTKRNIGALPVMQGNNLIGIVSDRDLVHAVANGVDLGISVTAIMTSNPVTVTRRTITKECEDLMKEHNFRHLLVLENGKLIGIISIKDILVATRQDYQFIADQLHGYIAGG